MLVVVVIIASIHLALLAVEDAATSVWTCREAPTVSRFFHLLVLMVLIAGSHPLAAEEALWQALRQGDAVALMRHALAPGTGDPPNFTLDDCRTQRNLSAQGRAQARAIGERLREHGISQAEVYASQWCRCLETAELLGLGEVEALPALNSFFREPARGPAQTAAVLDFLAERDGGEAVVLVTHQVNITALTDVFPRSGEIVVARRDGDGGLTALGRLPPL